MGRGGGQEALTDAKALLYGRRVRRSVTRVKVAPAKSRRQGHSKFGFSPRRLGVDKDVGLRHEGDWYGTTHWAVRNPKPKWLDKFPGVEAETKTYLKAIENKTNGQFYPVQFGEIHDRGSGQSSPGSPRYLRPIEGEYGEGFSVNADFIEVVERAAGTGSWFISPRDAALVYRDDSGLTSGLVLPRKGEIPQ